MNSLLVYSANYADELAELTVSSGDAFKARLIDNKPSTRWSSLGSIEGTTETIVIEFLDENGNALTRSINRLMVLNCNLARFYFEYWTGSAWSVITESVFNAGTPNTAANVLVEKAAAVDTTKVRLTATHTIGAVAQKLIGEIKICLSVLSVRHIVSIDRKDWDDGDAFRLQGGKVVTFRNVTKFEAAVTFLQLTLASYEILAPLLKNRSAMTWVLWSDFRLADIYEIAAIDEVQETLDKKMQLYTLKAKVGEL